MIRWLVTQEDWNGASSLSLSLRSCRFNSEPRPWQVPFIGKFYCLLGQIDLPQSQGKVVSWCQSQSFLNLFCIFLLIK
jgi:hypothetical protein